MRKQIETEAKILNKLGKSLPKTKKVRKRSPSQGVKLDLNKTPPLELYHEALENLSSIKNNFGCSKDISKSYLNKLTSKSDIIDQILNKNQTIEDLNANEEAEAEYLNESFGNQKSNRQSANSGKISNTINDANLTYNTENTMNTINALNNQQSKIDLNEIIPITDKLKAITYMDPRLEYLMKTLDLENLLHLFNSNKLTFNDILFLSKEDLIEMNVALAPRNRILKFAELFKLHGKEFTLEEIIEFFNKNKNFIFNKKVELNIQYTFKLKNEEEKVNLYNFYENNVLSTANFNNQESSAGNNFAKPVTENIKISVNNELPNNINSSYSIANYVSGRVRNVDNYKRGESEERACQTELLKKSILENNISNLTSIKKAEDTPQTNEHSSHKINNIFANNLEEQVNSNRNDEEDLISEFIANDKQANCNRDSKQSIKTEKLPLTAIEKSTLKRNNKSEKVLSNMIYRKNNVIQKQFESISNEVEKYNKSYKELKEKSEDRKNRIRCIINRTQKNRSRSNDKSKDKLKEVDSINYNLSEFSSKFASLNRYNSNKTKGFEINSEDLRLEDERNFDDEMNRILNRIHTVSQQSLDSHSVQQLKRIKSLANLQQGEKHLKLVDIDFLNKEIDKLYEIWNQKHTIQSNLTKCNMNIVENKRLLKLLDDETNSLRLEETNIQDNLNRVIISSKHSDIENETPRSVQTIDSIQRQMQMQSPHNHNHNNSINGNNQQRLDKADKSS